MNYGFKLEWDEISQDLQDQKRDELMRFNWDNGNVDQEDFESLQEYLENEDSIDEANSEIESHFPIYF